VKLKLAFAGNYWCFATVFVRIVLRNPFTVLQILRMIQEMYQSDWKELWNCKISTVY